MELTGHPSARDREHRPGKEQSPHDHSSQPVAVVGAGPSPFSYACGGLTFSDFLAIDAGGATGLPINLVGATLDNAPRRVDLSLNPNLGGASVKDIDLYFTGTGGIMGIDLAVGGNNATINEVQNRDRCHRGE